MRRVATLPHRGLPPAPPTLRARVLHRLVERYHTHRRQAPQCGLHVQRGTFDADGDRPLGVVGDRLAVKARVVDDDVQRRTELEPKADVARARPPNPPEASVKSGGAFSGGILAAEWNDEGCLRWEEDGIAD
eukprot:7240642-Prymnesium_polylepis.1